MMIINKSGLDYKITIDCWG